RQRRQVDSKLNLTSKLGAFQRLVQTFLYGKRLGVWRTHSRKIRERCNDSVAQHYLSFDAMKVLAVLRRRWITGVEQIVNGRLDDVERIAQLMRDSTGNLPNSRQPLDALLSQEIFSLIGLLDDRQI